MPIQYPFGETWYSPSGAPLVFSSYYRDTKSGNDYAMARTYANRLGRFSAPDRHSGNQSNPQSLNRYAYSLNDPVNLADPSGMEPCELIVAKHRKWLERLEIAGLGPSNLPFDADFLGQDFPDGGCDLVGGGGGGGGGTSDPPLDDNYNPCDPDPSHCIVTTVTDTPPTPPAPPDQGPGICDLFPTACPGVGGPIQLLSGGLLGPQRQPAPPCAFNITINNRAGLGAGTLASAEDRIRSLFGAYVGTNFVTSGPSDYSLNVVNAAPGNTNLGQQTSTFFGIVQFTPAVYSNNIANYLSQGYSMMYGGVLGTVGAHELVHRITGIGDLKGSGPTDLMGLDYNPNFNQVLLNNSLSLTPDEGRQLQSKCLKKHP